MLGKRLKVVKPNFFMLLGQASLDLLLLFFLRTLLTQIIPVLFQHNFLLNNLLLSIIDAFILTSVIMLLVFRLEKLRYRVIFYENGFVLLNHAYSFASLGKLYWITKPYKHWRILWLPFRYSYMTSEQKDVTLNTLYQKKVFDVFHRLYVENKQYKITKKTIQ